MSSSPSPPPNEGPGPRRPDRNGHLIEGARPRTGNPFALRLLAVRRALFHSLTENDLRRIVDRLVEKARAGDLAAARLLLAYAIGSPAAAVDPDVVRGTGDA